MVNATLGGNRKRFKVEELFDVWAAGGGKLARTDAGACVVSHCRGMAFVGLRTEQGSRAVCLSHYEELKKAGLPAA
jgi:hypothetical protein